MQILFINSIMSTIMNDTSRAITQQPFLHPIAELFKIEWTSARIRFTEKKGSRALRNVFAEAVKLCKSDMHLAQITLNWNEIWLGMIIERNDSDATEDLKKLGNELAELIHFLHQK